MSNGWPKSVCPCLYFKTWYSMPWLIVNGNTFLDIQITTFSGSNTKWIWTCNHHILTYFKWWKLVIVFMASVMATAPPSPTELLKSLWLQYRKSKLHSQYDSGVLKLDQKKKDHNTVKNHLMHDKYRPTYSNCLRLVIVFMAADKAVAPSSPMELLLRLLLKKRKS